MIIAHCLINIYMIYKYTVGVNISRKLLLIWNFIILNRIFNNYAIIRFFFKVYAHKSYYNGITKKITCIQLI